MRQGNKKARKSIAIIGEGLTEYRYVDDMRTTERYRFSLVPGIPKHPDLDDIVMLANERVKAGYDYVLCLIDMDVIEGNHDKMEHYRMLKKDNPKIIFVESSPCTEYEMSRDLDQLREKEPEVYKSYSQMYKLFDIIKEITK